MQPLSYLEKNWAALSQAPFVFLIVLVLAFGAAYAAARWAYQSRLDSDASRLKLRDDRIVDLERKLAELHEVAESPPPKVETDGSGTDDYSAVIRQLVSRFIFDSQDPDPEVLAGRELPSMNWMNYQLQMMGKDWRIIDVRGPIAEIAPLSPPGIPTSSAQF